MSKPLSKSTLASIKANANGNETVLILIAEVERLQRLAKPNRKPTTRTIRHIDTKSKTVFVDERGGGYGSEYPNPNYGKVCPCPACS